MTAFKALTLVTLTMGVASLATPTITQANVVTAWGLTADNDLMYSPLIVGQYIYGSVTNNVPEIGYNGGLTRNYVAVFQLPDRPAGTRVDSASFSNFVTTVAGDPAGVDLWARPYRSSSTVLLSDFFAGVDDPNSTLIQRSYIPAGGSSNVRYNSNTTAASALADYLNAQYDNGANSSSYIFLRLNQESLGSSTSIADVYAADVVPYLANAYSSYGPYSYWISYFQPQFSPRLDISFAAVPEPTSLLAGTACSIGLLYRPNRRRRTARS